MFRLIKIRFPFYGAPTPPAESPSIAFTWVANKRHTDTGTSSVSAFTQFNSYSGFKFKLTPDKDGCEAILVR